MTSSNLKRFGNRQVTLLLAVTAWLIATSGAMPQEHESAAELARKCIEPQAVGLPECQAAKVGFGLPVGGAGLPPGAPVSPFLRTPAGKPAAAPPSVPRETAPEATEPPSEFQRFAASSVGRILPVFGARFFSGVPTTFAPLDRVPVTSDYILGPGDEILLRTWGQANLDVTLVVDRSGGVFIPQVGNIHLAGLQYRQLAGTMRSHLERIFRNFQFTVEMGHLRSVQIFVVGQVRRPGAYTVSSLSTLVNAVFASGGPSAEGSMRRIQLKREGFVAVEFDVYDLLLKGDKTKDARLLPGDVVYIPPAGPQIAVAGSVRNPGIFELKGETTAGDVIRMTGGLSAVADEQRATLERINRGASRQTLEFRLDAAGLATPLKDGDVLHVLTISPRIANAVTLRGNVANPGRFPWHAGMRLRDVIPDKQSLVTRDYWNKRNLLGFAPSEEAPPDDPAAEAHRPRGTTGIQMLPEINWSYAVIQRQNERDLSTELIPFHLGGLMLEGDDSQNLELRPGDVVTIFSQSDLRVPVSQQTRLVRLEGEFNRAGIYAVNPGETLAQLIQRVGGLTPQAYLFGSEFLREATRVDQQHRLDEFIRDLENEVEQEGTLRTSSSANTGEMAAAATKLERERRLVERLRAQQATGRIVLHLDPDDRSVAKLTGISLEDGDRFVVPARPMTVNVLGAVYNQNSFLHESRLTVADYLQQAGGVMRNSDRGRMFVIRADGSLVPKRGARLKGGFEAQRLNAGDSLVVPQMIFKTTFSRELRDWTHVFAQFALGAAVVNILR